MTSSPALFHALFHALLPSTGLWCPCYHCVTIWNNKIKLKFNGDHNLQTKNASWHWATQLTIIHFLHFSSFQNPWQCTKYTMYSVQLTYTDQLSLQLLPTISVQICQKCHSNFQDLRWLFGYINILNLTNVDYMRSSLLCIWNKSQIPIGHKIQNTHALNMN